MARTPKPWFRDDRQAWYVTIEGQRHNLGPDKDEAFRRFHEMLATRPAARSVIADGLTVAEVFDKYLTWCKQHRAALTHQGYHLFIQDLIDHLKDAALLPATELRPFHVSEWIDQHPGWGPTRRRSAMIAVQRPYNWAFKLGYIRDNPIRFLEKPQAKRRETYFTLKDFLELLGKVKDAAFRDLLTFAWETGCRPQEVRHIEERHVNLAARRIEIPPAEAKGRKRWRIIRLSDKALAIIRRLLPANPGGKLFLNAEGNPWSSQAIVCRFQRLKKKLGKGWAAYDLRHGFAQRMLENGADVTEVAALMGHANAVMVSTVYSHMDRADDHLAGVLRRVSGSSA